MPSQAHENKRKTENDKQAHQLDDVACLQDAHVRTYVYTYVHTDLHMPSKVDKKKKKKKQRALFFP